MARHSELRHLGASSSSAKTRRNLVGQAVGLLGEILLICAVICALYIVWQLWWTGVESERTQAETRQEMSWTQPAKDGETTTVAQPQQGDPPAQPTDPQSGELMAQLYVPRFGKGWSRNIVEGTDAEQLAMHGLGHYPDSQLPGQVGNFAVAGHRSGYGEPLGDVNLLQPGDTIIVRTQDYWYVYTYTKYQIVDPSDTWTVAPNPDPNNPYAEPTKRLITLTTCEPKYQVATHRWISWGELKYWAKVSDGVPEELSEKNASGGVLFTGVTKESAAARIGSLDKVVYGALLAWLVLFLAAAVAWRWPVLRAIREGERPRPQLSLCGWLLRHQPGVLPVRLLLFALLVLAGMAALFQWAFPWGAANIPVLQEMSNYVQVA